MSQYIFYLFVCFFICLFILSSHFISIEVDLLPNSATLSVRLENSPEIGYQSSDHAYTDSCICMLLDKGRKLENLKETQKTCKNVLPCSELSTSLDTIERITGAGIMDRSKGSRTTRSQHTPALLLHSYMYSPLVCLHLMVYVFVLRITYYVPKFVMMFMLPYD